MKKTNESESYNRQLEKVKELARLFIFNIDDEYYNGMNEISTSLIIGRKATPAYSPMPLNEDDETEFTKQLKDLPFRKQTTMIKKYNSIFQKDSSLKNEINQYIIYFLKKLEPIRLELDHTIKDFHNDNCPTEELTFSDHYNFKIPLCTYKHKKMPYLDPGFRHNLLIFSNLLNIAAEITGLAVDYKTKRSTERKKGENYYSGKYLESNRELIANIQKHNLLERILKIAPDIALTDFGQEILRPCMFHKNKELKDTIIEAQKKSHNNSNWEHDITNSNNKMETSRNDKLKKILLLLLCYIPEYLKQPHAIIASDIHDNFNSEEDIIGNHISLLITPFKNLF